MICYEYLISQWFDWLVLFLNRPQDPSESGTLSAPCGAPCGALCGIWDKAAQDLGQLAIPARFCSQFVPPMFSYSTSQSRKNPFTIHPRTVFPQAGITLCRPIIVPASPPFSPW